MRTIVITPPSTPWVTWEEADAHLGLLGDDDQQLYVEGLIDAACASIDGPGGWLGRALGPQVLEARFGCFTADPLRLPYPPVIDIVSVKYLDSDGAEQTLDAAEYELMGAELLPAWDKSWPSIASRAEAVRVRYRAGYAADPGAEPLPDPLVPAVPAPIKAAVLQMVGDMFNFRETVVTGTIATAIPHSAVVDALLAPYRVYT